MKNFNSKRLSMERKKLGLSYEEMANKLRAFIPTITKQSCWQWETLGVDPEIRHVMAICAFFDKDPDYFLIKKHGK